MTRMTKPVRRVTDALYKHYGRPIVTELFADTISLRLKGTRKRYEAPVTEVMDYFCRREALIAMRAKAQAKKLKKQQRTTKR